MRKQILFNEAMIQNKIYYLGKEISKDYYENNLILICVLKGSYLFFSDLVKHIKIKNEPENCF